MIKKNAMKKKVMMLIMKVMRKQKLTKLYRTLTMTFERRAKGR